MFLSSYSYILKNKTKLCGKLPGGGGGAGEVKDFYEYFVSYGIM
jgi:hypothetical protein